MEPDLIALAEAASEFELSTSVLFKYLREGKLRRWRRTGDRRTFVDRGELRRLLQPRVIKPGGKR